MAHFTLRWIGALMTNAAAYDTSIFQAVQSLFDSLLGDSPTVEALVVASGGRQLYHEGAAYHPPTRALWVVADGTPNTTQRAIFRVTGLESRSTAKVEEINHTIPIPVGAYRNTIRPLGDVILFAAQGTRADYPPAGVYAMNPYPPYNTSVVVGSYGANPLNSLDDVTVTPDGVVYFSDPIYGFGQGNRPQPILPNQVYAYNPFTKDLRVAADGFGRPNGLAVSPDGDTVYIADTGAQPAENEPLDFQGARTIYAFDRVDGFLTNRRVFAMPQALASGPDGIKTDTYGNLWACVANQGVSVWDRSGMLLGNIAIDTAGGNLGFGEPGELFLLGGDTIYKISVATSVQHG
ncbi:hypothetical protein LTR53_014346 [Teratosphaeriaceae sp. CCFEE 6253]|nr:hypothetical protein LTR53_014346 [Teratosphaeriaceae sp. CCFEE 6253]